MPGQRVLVAFSGGPDSTALLATLKDLSAAGGFEVHAAHVDHRLDPDSSRRAAAARRLSQVLEVPFHLMSPSFPPGAEEGPEAAARRIRYGALERLRKDLGARYVVTAHHRDDQAETVALRIVFGSGLGGLEGIRPVHRRVLRPFLKVARRDLLTEVRRRGLPFVDDPTNRDLQRPRNLFRHHLLKALEGPRSRLRDRLAAVAAAAGRARHAWTEDLFHRLSPRPVEKGWGLPLEPLRGLPEEVQALALDLLHRLAGSPYPATSAAHRELRRQLSSNGRIGVDCGGRLRWERRGKLLVVAPHATPTPFFSYTLQMPGEVWIEELAASFRLSPAMESELPGFRRTPSGNRIAPGPLGVVQRALFGHVLTAGETVTLRNRRPGDCMRPPGARDPRRLKELLTDRRVPLAQRDRLLLVCAGGEIIWIPGLGVDDRFRPGSSGPIWLAEISADEP